MSYKTPDGGAARSWFKRPVLEDWVKNAYPPVKTNGFAPGEMLSLYSANLASPNWPLVVWLILSKRRCLDQSGNTHSGIRGRLGEMPPKLELLKIDASQLQTTQRPCLNTRQDAVGLLNEICPDGRSLFSGPWKWLEKRILLFWIILTPRKQKRHYGLVCNKTLFTAAVTQNQNAETTYVTTYGANIRETWNRKKGVTRRMLWNNGHDSETVNSRSVRYVYLYRKSQYELHSQVLSAYMIVLLWSISFWESRLENHLLGELLSRIVLSL